MNDRKEYLGVEMPKSVDPESAKAMHASKQKTWFDSSKLLETLRG